MRNQFTKSILKEIETTMYKLLLSEQYTSISNQHYYLYARTGQNHDNTHRSSSRKYAHLGCIGPINFTLVFRVISHTIYKILDIVFILM